MRKVTRPTTAKCTSPMYIAFLISEPKSATCMRLAEVTGISHDNVNRFLQRESYQPKDIFDQLGFMFAVKSNRLVSLEKGKWDTAFKPSQINDPSVCTTWAETKFTYYLLDVWRDGVGYPQLKSTVKSLFEKWNPTAILIEDKASGQSLIQELRETTKLPVIAITPETDKLTRMSSQSAKIEAGKMFIPESAPWLPDYERELFTFPKSEHDDQIDSTSQFLNWVSSNKQVFAYSAVSSGRFKRKET